MHVKLRGLRSHPSNIIITDTFTTCNQIYTLQSAMIFLGRDNAGHWISVIKETSGYVLYDDDKIPKKLSPTELANNLKKKHRFVLYPR